MDAVAGDGALERATVAEVNGDDRHRTHRLPMQYESLPQRLSDRGVRIIRSPEEAAIGAAQLLVEPTEQTQAQDRLPFTTRRRLGALEIRVPVEARCPGVALCGDLIDDVG